MSKQCLSSSPSSSPLNGRPNVLTGAHSWLVAEQAAQLILCMIQPTLASEHRRNEVTDYLQTRIREHFGTEVLPFGSVPLKTYLPDGDIDLTVVCCQGTEEDLATDICNFLESEERMGTGFVVNRVEYVRAQVRVLKCTVKDIAVDISFNQMAGLNALCFLEQVDQSIGKDHLFKRSILLIKAWCYYESRTLGAIHSLISTYALDLLVLHVVNLFHSSLNGPLSVLYKFLDYYGCFDWEKYCVSLNGPVAISSLPELAAATPQNDGSDLLLSQEFVKYGPHIFLASPSAVDTCEQAFPVKHLNIIDPLKDSNNLGRSVGKANFHRIQFAFSYGAEKLGEVIMLPQESISEGLKNFFVNTLHRNGMGQRPDVKFPVPVFGTEKPDFSDLTGDYCHHLANLVYGHHFLNYTSSLGSSPSNNSEALQLYQIYFSSLNMKDFVGPVLFYPLSFAQPSGGALVDQKLVTVRESASYIPAVSVEEKFSSEVTGSFVPHTDSRGTGTFIPDIRVQEKLLPKQTKCMLGINVEDHMKSSGTGVSVPDKGAEGKCKYRGTVTTIPKRSGEPGGISTCIPDRGIEENAKSRWTSTYSQDEESTKPQGSGKLLSSPSKSPNNQMRISGKTKNAGRTTQGVMLPSSLKNEQVDVSSGTKEESSSCLDLSLEEFPLLPGFKVIPFSTPQLYQQTAVESQKSSPLKESVELGFFEPCSPPLGSSWPIASGQPEFDSTSKDSMSSERKKEMALVEKYKLEDDEDFPPLFGESVSKKGVWGGRPRQV